MVTPATSFFDADSNLEKLVGGGRVCKSDRNPRHKTFFFARGTFVAYETSAGLFPTDYLRPEFVFENVDLYLKRPAGLKKMKEIPGAGSP